MWKPITLLCILLLPCVSCTLTRDGRSYDEEAEEETKNINHLNKLLNQVSSNLHSAKEADKRNEQKRRPKDVGDRNSADLNNEVSPDGKSSSSSDQRKTESSNDNPKSSRGKIQPYKGKQDKTKSSVGKPLLPNKIHLSAILNKMVSNSSKTKSKPCICKSNSAHVKVKPSNGKQGKTGSSTFKKTLTGDQNQQSRGQTTEVKEVDSDNTKSSRVTQSSPLRPLINKLMGKMLSDKTRQRKVAKQVQGKNKPSDDKSDSSRSVNPNRPSSKQGTVSHSDRSKPKSSDTKSSGRSSDTNQVAVIMSKGKSKRKHVDDDEDDLRSRKGKSKRKDDDDKEDDLRSRKGKSKRKDDDDKEDDLRSRKGKSKRKDDDEDDLRSRKGKSKRKYDDEEEGHVDRKFGKGKSKRQDADDDVEPGRSKSKGKHKNDKEDDLQSRKGKPERKNNESAKRTPRKRDYEKEDYDN